MSFAKPWRWLTAAALWLSVALGTTSCGILFSEDEVARTPSPAGRFDAVLVETNGGATTSFGYRVLIVIHGSHWRTGLDVAFLYGAVRSRDAFGANLKWRDDVQLAVEYLEARDAKLPRPVTTLQGTSVSTALVAGVSDSTAPPGGMLYNLQGRPHD
jgi:hypothetical protein